MDYCNSLLYGLPTTQTSRLQRIQNTAARIVSMQPKRNHITPVLAELHWLPVQQRIQFKILVFVFKSLNQLAPTYLCELIKPYEPSRNLHSSSSSNLSIRIPKTNFGARAFSIAGPTLWNNLPRDLKLLSTLSEFKSSLKTHLFNEAFCT